jgi:demethylsterigmatocystin 6-O-methyltransferase
VESAPKHAGVEPMAQDFFLQQQVHSARIYYMRNILHNWSDDTAVHILENTREAMGAESVLLVDELVLPDRGGPWDTAQLDMVMLSLLAALERTHTQWIQLIERAGLRITKVYNYVTGGTDSVIECVPA